MNRPYAAIGLIGLALGSVPMLTAAHAPKPGAEEKAAAKSAGRAAKALAKRHDADAVALAEQAVAFAPRVAGYRLLLGRSYLRNGRFASAGQAFADTLRLDAGNGKAALNLALAQVAIGDGAAARQTLATYAELIPASDRGLALALAGDPVGAVAVLTAAARSGETGPKVRQNLALAYALAGEWPLARVVAAADLSPADVDARMEQWAAFAQPAAASDQVASLLGVQAAADGGQPAALALTLPSDPPVAVAAASVAIQPKAVPAEQPAPTPVAAAAPTIRFAARREVVQALPAPLIVAPGPIKVAAKARLVPVRRAPVRMAMATGDWFVQLGAYDSAGVARDAWGRAQRRYAGWAGRTPSGLAYRTGTATYYRLSVGGFARADAVSACRQYRARGGDCFVRTGAGDQIASWVKQGGKQIASR